VSPWASIHTPRPFATLAEALAASPGVRVLDVRGEDAFARGHVAGAGRLSLEEFAERRAELPAREVAVLVVDDVSERAHAAAEALAALGYGHVGWLARPLGDERDGRASTAPAARLWSPSAFVERAVAGLAPGRALDLACGSGRAAVLLALAGWRAEGWDADASALARARALAERHRVDIVLRELDLEAFIPAVPEPPFDLIVVVRYLHRPLFPWIERALAPGGTLVYETFRDGQQAFGPPRRERHLLRRGELLGAFPALAVEQHEETPDDMPPVLTRMSARKPG